jgi:hypothetical protein
MVRQKYRQRLRQVAGALLVVLGAVSFYIAWVLTRRTVFDYVYLGGWGVSTGVVLVGVLLTVTFGGVIALSRGYRRFVAGKTDRNGDASPDLPAAVASLEAPRRRRRSRLGVPLLRARDGGFGVCLRTSRRRRVGCRPCLRLP